MKSPDIHAVIPLLRQACSHWATPVVTVISADGRSPYKVLVSCIISLRTKDEVTAPASARLFEKAATPEAMLLLTVDEIASCIYPAGFYRNKAVQILEISRRLVNEFKGVVPDDMEILLGFKGVGRKTANLVLTQGFLKPGICVDTHVHRICNRLGYVNTAAPDKTEMALRQKLPPEYWLEINDLLVAFGQNLCHPVSPRCSCCPLTGFCNRCGVSRHR